MLSFPHIFNQLVCIRNQKINTKYHFSDRGHKHLVLAPFFCITVHRLNLSIRKICHVFQKQAKPSRNSPVPEQLQEKQQKVENLEKEIQQKEKHLKSSRNKEATKHSLKTKYVKLLEYRVIEQEERLLSLQSVQDELFKTRLDNEKLGMENRRQLRHLWTKV